MKRIQCLVFMMVVALGDAINRSVYKIVLTQRGFAQFIQYDVETPPIREFTFCSWLRFFDLSREQSVFTYVANGNNRVVRLWLDSGGRHVQISLNGRPTSSTLVDITKNNWRHICLSYQSDFGAWALYLDGRLVSCEAAQSLRGSVIPGGGSVIIGYGTTDNGIPNGLEGEVFGANIILASTIERNYTIKRDPQYRQKTFNQNKVSSNNNIKYIVLNDMTIDTIQETSESTRFPILNNTRSFIKFSTPHSTIEHDVGLDLQVRKNKLRDASNEKEILDFSVLDKSFKSSPEKNSFWTLMNEAGNIGKFKARKGKKFEQSGSGTQELPTVSEFETPPPPISFQDFVRTNVRMKKPVIIPYFDIKEYKKPSPTKITSEQNIYGISDIEKPPPQDKKPKVYGQWTSSQFANSVLNYIKNFNSQYNEPRMIPPTIPLVKFSDTYPYASDFKLTKVRPPFKIQRRNFIDARISKRDVRQPEINVEILEDDLRNQILESHAKTQPKNVRINYRGQIKNGKDERNYRDVNNQLNSDQNLSSEIFETDSKSNSDKSPSRFNFYKSSSLMSILPFLKSGEYFFSGKSNKKSIIGNDVYTNSLSSANKWHNVKSYNNDFTPRHINMESGEINVNIDKKIADTNKKYPSVRLKYMPKNHKIVKNIDDVAIADARNLAMEISNSSNINTDSVSILKYNHGFLPSYNKNSKFSTNDRSILNNNLDKNTSNKNKFNQNVKIGNALNEKYVIGKDEEQNRHSFIGGDEKIPDINRYRSNYDLEGEGEVPPSLGPKICKNVEFYDRLFYVQPDGSIDVTKILSPVKEKNPGIEFVVQNYRKCSLEDSIFQYSSLLYIDWSKTPVRLFGGAYPQKTTDLCGFF